MDLHDLHQNTRDGVHMASLAGAWIALVAGFGGMRDHDGELSFAPRLPSRISRLEFSLLWRGLRLRVDVAAARGDLLAAQRRRPAVELLHHGKEIGVTAGEAGHRADPAGACRPVRQPTQPRRPRAAGRAAADHPRPTHRLRRQPAIRRAPGSCGQARIVSTASIRVRGRCGALAPW